MVHIVSCSIIPNIQGEYEQEGVDVTHVSYEDNRPLLELLLTVSDA